MDKECDSNYDIDLKEVRQILKDHKKLEVCTLIIEQEYQNNVSLIVKDHENEYTLIVIDVFDISNTIQEEKLKKAKQRARALQQCNHPNIIKYLGEFFIDKYYFILLEKCENSLQNWADDNNNKNISNSTFVDFALQIIEGVQYLHSKNMYLNILKLKNILLSKNKQIKLTEFEFIEENDINQPINRPRKYLSLYYSPPESINQQMEEDDINEQLNYAILGDIWLVCLSLYQLAGAHDSQFVQFNLGNGEFHSQEQVGYQINLLLLQVFQRDPKQRPSLEQIVEILKQIDQVSERIISQAEQEEDIRLFEQSKVEFDSDNYDVSFELLRKLLNKYPRNDIYLSWIGRVFNAAEKYDESEYWSNQSLKLNPKSELGLYNLGNSYKGRYQNEKAIHFYQKVLEINPLNDYALNNLGVVYQNQQNYHQANIVYKKAMNIDPNETHYLYNLGRNKFLQEQYEKSLRLFKKTLKIIPQDFESKLFFKRTKKNI